MGMFCSHLSAMDRGAIVLLRRRGAGFRAISVDARAALRILSDDGSVREKRCLVVASPGRVMDRTSSAKHRIQTSEHFMRRSALGIFGCLVATFVSASAAEFAYQVPPAPIPAMIDAAPTPAVVVSHDHRKLAILGRENLPSVAALARPVLRLGGWRIDPRTNGPAEIRMNWLTSIVLEDVGTGAQRAITLPRGLRFTAVQWSPDNRHLAFVAEVPHGLELWVVDADGTAARKLTPGILNAAFGVHFEWTPDGRGLVFPRVPAARGAQPLEPAAPIGPNVQESAGRVAPDRTYEDLLKNGYDEALFDHYFTAALAQVDLASGKIRPIGEPGLISHFDLSPDGRFILVERLHRPFSYIVPSHLFPTEIGVWETASGRMVRKLTDRPLADGLPIAFDAVPAGPRAAEWRADAPATLVWVEALDGGDPGRVVDFHDRLLAEDAPFKGVPSTLLDMKSRFYEVEWGQAGAAVVSARWWKNRHETRTVIDPTGAGTPRDIIERNYQDVYAEPGNPLTQDGPFHRPVMAFTADGDILMTGPGATRDGEQPFLASLNLATGTETKLWQADPLAYESVVALLDGAGHELLTRRESAVDAPNFYVRAVGPGAPSPRRLTQFQDPEPQFSGVTKQLIAYKRADGVDLSGTLYLPAGYDKGRDGPLPMLMWAYPTEFTDPRVAGQVVDRSKNRFTRPQGISHLFLLTQGYAILDGFSAPIIGANGAEPNDSYVEQLVADAKAAVDAVAALGVADRDRVAVGGHSYGAFMTANLLAHSDLFRAGIARSGAYNRTLTPFGFQAEQRSYWQATDVYTQMSPFTYAPQIKAPILLMHGEADDNSGTFPIQSERFYAALKGAGATVRYVTLPNEPHGYRGRESTLHTLWEMANWLDRYVKHAPPRATQ
jgi:dipeptidyl aminopeptidase/acylaminoacyl peptidase